MGAIMEAVNWDALSAISELLGVLIVAVTVIYLAFQVRQGSSQLQTNAFRTAMFEYTNQIQLIMLDKENLDVFRYCVADYANRSKDEQARFHGIMLGVVRSYIINMNLESSSLLSSKFMESFDADLVAALSCPGATTWWAQTKRVFDPLAVAHIDGLLIKYAGNPLLTDVLPFLNIDD
jgi:hypothetical protein